MLVMALDTSLQKCSVAIIRDGVCLAEAGEEMERGHAEFIGPMAADVLLKAAVNIRDLDRIGVVVGPGGFTGVRIALAFARGLALGGEIPIVGVTSLRALAGYAIPNSTTKFIAPVIDARRGQVYAALFDKLGEEIIAPFVGAPDHAAAILAERADGGSIGVLGGGASLLNSANWRMINAPTQIDAKIVAALAAAAEKPLSRPAPLYLRPPDAKPPTAPAGRFA